MEIKTTNLQLENQPPLTPTKKAFATLIPNPIPPSIPTPYFHYPINCCPQTIIEPIPSLKHKTHTKTTLTLQYI